MAKNLKINIMNTQIAKGIDLGNLKQKLGKNKELSESKKPLSDDPSILDEASKNLISSPSSSLPANEEMPRIRARSKSAFGENTLEVKPKEDALSLNAGDEKIEKTDLDERPAPLKTSEELRHSIFAEEIAEQLEPQKEQTPLKASILADPLPAVKPVEDAKILEKELIVPLETKSALIPEAIATPSPVTKPKREQRPVWESLADRPRPQREPLVMKEYVKLGPTGRHVKDLLPKPKPEVIPEVAAARGSSKDQVVRSPNASSSSSSTARTKPKPSTSADKTSTGTTEVESEEAKKNKAAKFKEFKDIKPAKRVDTQKSFDTRDRQGLREGEEEGKAWRKKRHSKIRHVQEDTTIRPTSLKVRVPISIKDLAIEMKLKASQLVQKLFMQGIVATLNDLLEDETTIQLLGHEFSCEIALDTSEEERIRITDKNIKEEISGSSSEELSIRPPVVTFMGHVDHGKTSLIDAIRKSNRAAGEAGAITQHIGAFRCHTPVGDIAILDTPGHEAFSAMRARGANVTDIVVLVVAGDEGIRQQTVEAIENARQANVIIVVAINKCDKPNFNLENVYRQLAEKELLPEAWGGQTICVNCSATTGEGVPQLLEMLALQAEILELRANPSARARGMVLESEMHKGMGPVATVLVQNGTLKLGDALVFGDLWCRVKTMRNEFDHQLSAATPSTPVEITGLSGLPEAGQEFIVVKSEKEARDIAETRRHGLRQSTLQQKKKISAENMLQHTTAISKKVLSLVLRADVQGSLEALKTALEKIKSDKAELNIFFTGVGEITESDVQLAAASKATIIGFHTAVESHADMLIKQYGVQVRLHDIIYHAIDDVKKLMVTLLDKIAIETDQGKAEVKALFKSSQVGVIAGCIVTEGSIRRNHHVRIKRKNEIIWKGSVNSLKRVKEDVREVLKGLECGVILNGFSALEEGDLLESYEISYITQEL